jgi:hypothetical protein
MIISIYRIFSKFDIIRINYRADGRWNTNLIKFLVIQSILFILTVIPTILAIYLSGNTNTEIVRTKVLFNEAVFRFHDRDADTNAIIQYITSVLLSITPGITFIFINGTASSLSLQLVAIGVIIWKIMDFVNLIRRWFPEDESETDTPTINNDNQPLLEV